MGKENQSLSLAHWEVSLSAFGILWGMAFPKLLFHRALDLKL